MVQFKRPGAECDDSCHVRYRDSSWTRIIFAISNLKQHVNEASEITFPGLLSCSEFSAGKVMARCATLVIAWIFISAPITPSIRHLARRKVRRQVAMSTFPICCTREKRKQLPTPTTSLVTTCCRPCHLPFFWNSIRFQLPTIRISTGIPSN